MAKQAKNPDRPKDTNQLAKLIADMATGKKEPNKKSRTKSPADKNASKKS